MGGPAYDVPGQKELEQPCEGIKAMCVETRRPPLLVRLTACS